MNEQGDLPPPEDTLEEVLEELRRYGEECGTPNWDGFDALPVGEDTLGNAKIFLIRLHDALGSISGPSFCCEPDGSLDIEWQGGASGDHILEVTLHKEDSLMWTLIWGDHRDHGFTKLEKDRELSPVIPILLSKVIAT
jgi:hypothetical protein